MSATLARELRDALEEGGLVASPIGATGPWQAIRELRAAMRAVRAAGGQPEVRFLHAVARDGRLVPGTDPRATLLLLGYRAGRSPGSSAATGG